MRIEDYALVGDLQSAAIVGKDGSVEWLCVPRFDSPACFAALVGRPEHGCWRIAPVAEATSVTRRYREGTLILETDLRAPTAPSGPAPPLHVLEGHGLGGLRQGRADRRALRLRRAGRAVAGTRDEIHDEVCEHGYDAERGTFTQYYGSEELDASTLNIPPSGSSRPVTHA